MSTRGLPVGDGATIPAVKNDERVKMTDLSPISVRNHYTLTADVHRGDAGQAPPTAGNN